MATNKYQIVVEGEASETDSDEEMYLTSAGSAHATELGIKVLGEAPESDSEVELDNKLVAVGNSESTQKPCTQIPHLVISSVGDSASTLDECPVSKLESSGPRNTLLQQKLQESNARLCNNVALLLRQVYQNAIKEVQMATSHFSNSQNGIINASHSIRLIVEDLKSVSEKIDIITTCNLLPDISITCP